MEQLIPIRTRGCWASGGIPSRKKKNETNDIFDHTKRGFIMLLESLEKELRMSI